MKPPDTERSPFELVVVVGWYDDEAELELGWYDEDVELVPAGWYVDEDDVVLGFVLTFDQLLVLPLYFDHEPF